MRMKGSLRCCADGSRDVSRNKARIRTGRRAFAVDGHVAGVAANTVTHNTLITACANAKQLGEARVRRDGDGRRGG